MVVAVLGCILFLLGDGCGGGGIDCGIASVVCVDRAAVVEAGFKRVIETSMTKDVTTQRLHPHRIRQ